MATSNTIGACSFLILPVLVRFLRTDLTRLCFSTGHRHVSVWQFVPLSLHLHGSGRGRLLRCRLLLGAPAPLPERSAPPTQVQPVLPPHDGTRQHPANDRRALHGQRRGSEGGRPGPGQPRVRRHPGLHLGGDQPLVHHLLGLRVRVTQSVRGERLGQRAAEHPAPGQWAGLEPGQAGERLPFSVSKGEKNVGCCCH